MISLMYLSISLIFQSSCFNLQVLNHRHVQPHLVRLLFVCLEFGRLFCFGFFVLICFFQDWVSLCSSGFPGISSTDQAGL